MVQHKLRVLLVDDHEIVRRGLKTAFDELGDIVVVGEAGTVASAVDQAIRLRPDIVVMDLRLPDGSGVEACRQIRAKAPGSKVVILTSYPDMDALYSAVMAGAAGYVLKDLDVGKLHETMVSVARGGSLLDPQMTTSVLERLRNGESRHPADDAFSMLTQQEDRILELIGEGLTNRGIAEQLCLSEKTIKNYVSRIYAKLHIERRAQAARVATERRVRREQL